MNSVRGCDENVLSQDVLITAGGCSVRLLPRFGGKIASIRIDGCELLQPPLAPVAPRTPAMTFDQGDAGGWDECLPSVAACTVETARGPVPVPDHGDLWRVEWKSRKPSGGPNSAVLAGACLSLPLVLERELVLAELPSAWRLALRYTLTNVGIHPAPWSWAAHPLFRAEAGDRVELPPSVDGVCVEASGGDRLGRAGDRLGWPVATPAAGGRIDLGLVGGPESTVGDKLFAGPLGDGDGWCLLDRPSAGVRIRVRFDPAATPWLGLWLCYGGWPSRPGPKQYCVAMEPATAPVDSLACSGPWSRTLAPGASCSWPMTVEIERRPEKTPGRDHA